MTAGSKPSKNAERLSRERQYLEDLELDYLRCERRLGSYVRSAWDVLEPTTKMKWNWHHELMAEYLEAVALGQIKRLIINVPPRELKSTIATVSFPTWVWGPRNLPQKRFLFGSYAEDLAVTHSLLRRNLIRSDWYQSRWGDRFHLSGDQNAKSEYTNDKTGQMTAAGILGSVTGKGGDIILLDDPHDPKGAKSDADREAILFSIDNTWSTRLNDPNTGAIVVVMQRLHEQDASGHLLDKGGWTHLKLRRESEERERHVYPVTGKIFEREAGELLHPDRVGVEAQRQKRKDLGEVGYEAQEQQNPVPKGGGIIKPHWFKYYRVLPDGLSRFVISCDFTFKDTKGSDFVAMQVWASKDVDHYLIDQVYDRMDFLASLKALVRLCEKYPNARRKLVEDKANGPAIISTVKGKVEGVIPFNPGQHGSKGARLEDCSITFEGGNIYFPHPDICTVSPVTDGPWIHINEKELLSFGRTKHDDTVDATTQYLIDAKENQQAITRLDRLITM